ncbi:MAG: DNA helicase UvrD [Candidatus Roizmanbacteria bacterium]|nr:MAG: DNA helicase UvrD [Candidatus Roizmanbacteria bacterium]
MPIIADLHVHSKYSRAVSQKMDLDGIAEWASKKGIGLMATGDWQHPLYFREIKIKLKETSPGIYSLVRDADLRPLHNVKFLLSTEISSIYSQGGKTRRIHYLVFAPSIQIAEKIIKELQKRGANLMSDGRPILGISAKDVLEMLLEIDENILLIPAHAWTPWYSIFGSKSGFDSVEECFGNMAKYIYAVETGLSSDPIMNWQINDLNNRSIVSFSDAHSGPKLGRETTVFVPSQNSEPTTQNYSYQDIIDAIKQKAESKLKIGYTIEFFPEEGKYHWSGHRACGVRYNAQEVKEKGTVCPVCKQPLTIGVENRVLDLSDKTINPEELIYLKNNAGLTFVYDKEKKRKPFVSLVPLLEILLEINNHSQIKAENQYENLINNLGTEFEILIKKSYEEIEKIGGRDLKCAIQPLRERKVFVDPGYDGVFGVVKINSDVKSEDNEEKATNEGTEKQATLF